MTVIEEIAAERRRQIDAEGWTLEHDDTHDRGQMALAAACYARWTADKSAHETTKDWARKGKPPIDWPWHGDWFKPKSLRRDLIRAGALIVAEIERLDRDHERRTRTEIIRGTTIDITSKPTSADRPRPDPGKSQALD